VRLLWIAACRILGLCNNFAYVIMLSAAHDILMPEALVRANFFPTILLYLNYVMKLFFFLTGFL